MSDVPSSTRTRPADRQPSDDNHPVAPPRYSILEIELVAEGDPIRLARILATMVNNSPMALSSVHVGDLVAYPVPAETASQHGPMVLTLRMRDHRQHIDVLIVEQIVGVVSVIGHVLNVRTTV